MNSYDKKYAALALTFAFTPSVLLLALQTSHILSQHLGLACVVSVACCFGSTGYFFSRENGLAVLAGFSLLLLNLAISFLFGCGAVLSN